MTRRLRVGALWALLLATPVILSAEPSTPNPPGAASAAVDLRHARALWLAADTLAWAAPDGSSVRLHGDPAGALEPGVTGLGGAALNLQAAGLVAGALASQYPHLAGLPAWRVPEQEMHRVPALLRGQFALAAYGPDGHLRAATSIQPAGVLDALYRYQGPLGVHFTALAGNERRPLISLWAPTARAVRIHLFADAAPGTSAHSILPMQRDSATGVWSIEGSAGWDRQYYLYEVEVFTRTTGRFERSLVTDPWAYSLAGDSRRVQIVDLADPDLLPEGWGELRKPPLDAPEDIVLYELHVRDFSIGDHSVPPALRGTFAAFGLTDSNGARHLRRLAAAGVTHLHLLPTNDCASVPEYRSDQAHPGDLSGHPPDSRAPQAAIEPIRDRDGFNWCYDPWHYSVPEGSYSTDPDGIRRIIEFRQMVASLNRMGLRVVLDVVYNHTPASGLAAHSVLDRIVPDYYQRLDADGRVETSTCCANTASEHALMERLMLDSLLTWARDYKVDGFRFDLMGHHGRATIERARDLLHGLDPDRDGVDGRSIYLYGEGWNFGEVADDARFEQATQANMGRGSGVGTFNDRLRDALRGGRHDDRGWRHVRGQGFVNGLYADPNELNSGSAAERAELLRQSDLVRAGLAGSLARFALVDHSGQLVTADQLDYGGMPAAYASDPQEVINYAAAHDNETLFDINQYKLPRGAKASQRLRAQNLANSVIALAQGIPFFHAGQELLRSKSLDRNSYNSGDWFNPLDFTYRDNGWGRGLPPRDANAENWEVAAGLLADPGLQVGPAEIGAALEHFEEMLRIRRSSTLFRLRTADEVIERLAFHNTGPEQVPGLVVMSVKDGRGVAVVVLFNAAPETRDFVLPIDGQPGFELHPVQQGSRDPLVRTAGHDRARDLFRVPGRTTAVFVRAD